MPSQPRMRKTKATKKSSGKVSTNPAYAAYPRLIPIKSVSPSVQVSKGVKLTESKK